MDKLSRRRFLAMMGATSLSGLIYGCTGGGDENSADSDNADSSTPPTPTPPSLTLPQTGLNGLNGHVVVVGGGMGGATAAKFLRLWGGQNLKVTLIEKNPAYTSNILSNLVLTGQRSLASLDYSYAKLVSNYGVTVLQGEVSGLDPVARSIRLADGSSLSYDRVILSPGIDFDAMPGLDNYDDIVHAWQAGPQTARLRDQLLAMPSGGIFVMTIPAVPYRCPPGPYERACVVADYLKRNKPGSKVIVLDANPAIAAERATFELAFNNTHAGVIEYHPNVAISSIDPTSRLLQTSLGNVAANVLNPIPPHRAGRLVSAAGLANVDGRWAGVDVLSYESTVAVGVHIIGDASATTQPKAGHIANAEAKVCADAVIRLMSGQTPDPSPVTNSACYSPITASTASWLTAIYHYDPASKSMKAYASGEASSVTRDNYDEMFDWFDNLMADTFA
jgi:NADPH-dependent 2,4-dienoyl-CoA reductase/sulfur reductase-like enzyme